MKPYQRASKKIHKLVTKPKLFLRDYFLKLTPLEETADINRKTSVDARSKKRAVKGPIESVKTLMSGFVSFSRDVDAVITWVDGSDAEFLARREAHRHHDTSGKIAANNAARYQSHDEIRYCVRSIRTYAPWIRTIYIVTNGQVPNWFDADQDRVKIVSHQEIIPDEYLPTFNSHVIESCLHRIPGLSEHFVYFNDDVMLLQPAKPTDFFTETGLMRGFVSTAVIPNGPICQADTPSMTAIKNARKLLFDETGYHLSPKFAHTFHPQRRSVGYTCEEVFSDALHACRVNKFRNTSDVLCTSFLFPCYAYVTGAGVFSRLRAWYFNVRDVTAKNLYTKLHQFKSNPAGPKSVCLNDHLPDSLEYNFQGYDAALAAFLQAYFPVAFEFERDGIRRTTQAIDSPVRVLQNSM